MANDPPDGPNVPDGTWVIIPVHNRRDVTENCLTRLRSDQAWEKLNVIVVDDGSTDGTAELVTREFPSVHLLEGDGDLWWGGAMRMGMEYAADNGAAVFIWLNDDVIPQPGVLAKLASKTAALGDTVLGSVVHPTTGHEYSTRWFSSYLGIDSKRYEPDREIQPCELVAGKMVAFPRPVVEAIGYPATGAFDHGYADFEYTYRASEHGFDVGVYSGAVAMDTAYTFAHSGLSTDYSFVSTVREAIDPSADRSIWMKYKRDKRFGTAHPLVILGYNVLKGAGTIAIKFGLCVTKRDHQFV